MNVVDKQSLIEQRCAQRENTTADFRSGHLTGFPRDALHVLALTTGSARRGDGS